MTRDFQLGRWQSICKPSAYYDSYFPNFKFQTVLSSSLSCGPFNWAQQQITLNTKSISGNPTRLSRSSNQGKVSAVACSRPTASDKQNGLLSSRKAVPEEDSPGHQNEPPSARHSQQATYSKQASIQVCLPAFQIMVSNSVEFQN